MSEQGEMAAIVEELPRRGRSVEYSKPLRVYANLIWPEKRTDNAVRTLKNWVKKGKAADPPDLPPFDQPEQLADWFERHHTWKASEELVRLREGDPSAKVAQAGGKAEAEEEESLPPMVLDLEAEMTVDMGLRQIRSLVSGTFEQMQKALAGGQMKQYQTLRREWKESVTLLRQWEKDLTKIQEGRGEVLRTRVINTELVQIFTALGQSFFNGTVNVLAVHAPEISADKRWAIAIAQRDQIFSHLNQSRFASAWEAAAEELEKAQP